MCNSPYRNLTIVIFNKNSFISELLLHFIIQHRTQWNQRKSKNTKKTLIKSHSTSRHILDYHFCNKSPNCLVRVFQNNSFWRKFKSYWRGVIPIWSLKVLVKMGSRFRFWAFFCLCPIFVFMVLLDNIWIIIPSFILAMVVMLLGRWDYQAYFVE